MDLGLRSFAYKTQTKKALDRVFTKKRSSKLNQLLFLTKSNDFFTHSLIPGIKNSAFILIDKIVEVGYFVCLRCVALYILHLR